MYLYSKLQISLHISEVKISMHSSITSVFLIYINFTKDMTDFSEKSEKDLKVESELYQ